MAFWSSLFKPKIPDKTYTESLFRPKTFRPEGNGKSPADIPNLVSGVNPSSGFNASTLREAIEDAKAVRATALANAQKALEDAFKTKIGEDLNKVLQPPVIIPPPLPDNCSNLPGYKIEFKDTAAGKFDDKKLDDVISSISGFNLNYGSLYGGSSSQANPNVSFTASYAISGSWTPPVNKSASYLPLSGAVQPNRTAPHQSGYDLMIGNPSWSNQINSITNSRGGKINLGNNLDAIYDGIRKFVHKMKFKHDGKNPRFPIKVEGATIRGNYNVEVEFVSLIHDGNNLKLILNFVDTSLDVHGATTRSIVGQQDEATRAMSDIERNCIFFIMGEFELDDKQEKITDMEIEYLGYSYKNNSGTSKKLFSIK